MKFERLVAMLKKRSPILLLLITAGLVFILYQGRSGTGKDNMQAPSPSNSYGLTKDELVVQEKLASNGDVAAMKKLSLYYGVYEEDLDKSLYWLEKMGDAGDLSARDYLLGHYAASKVEKEREYGHMLRKRWASKR